MPYALMVIAGEQKGENYPLVEGQAFTIGRDPSNDIRLFDRKLSRIHCQIQMIGGRCQVSDLNSTNGTMVNGRRIRDEVWIEVDDEVEVGMSRLRLVELAPAEAALAKETRSASDASDVSIPCCEECGKRISAEDLAANRVRRAGSRVYCLGCSASFEQGTVEAQPPVEPVLAAVTERGQPGREIAGVRIVSLIGEGRLGPLYRGEQISMGRLVALKMLNVPDPEWAEKYLHAVYTSGQLVHANVVLIFDTGREDDVYYVVREYVEGHSAQERLASREPVPVPDAYNIITQVGYALEHAFERHIFHGSLSPRRVLIGPRDSVKVTGFGLPRTPPPGRSMQNYTWHTLPYTPPERIRGEEVQEHAADVYSAVAIFYHLLTGRPPFTGSTREKIEHRIVNHSPRDVRELVPEIPEAAQKIIDRGLAKDPRARYQLPRELLFDLEETLRREI